MGYVKKEFRKNVPDFVRKYLDVDREERNDLNEKFKELNAGFTAAVANKMDIYNHPIQEYIISRSNAANEFFDFAPSVMQSESSLLSKLDRFYEQKEMFSAIQWQPNRNWLMLETG